MPTVNPRVRELIGQASQAVAALDDSHQAVIARMAKMLIEAMSADHRVLVCGNGGSAADAQHIAGELAGRFRRNRRALPCVALTTDTSVLTAIGNDYSYEVIFARQVEAIGREGDILWALSTSGGSPNVIAAAKAARARGMTVVAMTGAGGGPLAELAECCFRAPADRTDLIQLLHQLAYHIICELADAHFAGEA